MSAKLSSSRYIFILVAVLVTSIMLIGIIRIPVNRLSIFQSTTYIHGSNETTNQRTSRFDYYICTQVWNETGEHMVEWIEHQIYRLGFRNICVVSVEQPLNKSLVDRYRLATITKMSRAQEWKYCLECFTDPPMQPKDMLMIQDIDEFLNVQRADVVSSLHDSYDMFHFTDLRYGYVYEKDAELQGKSLLETNVYRRQNTDLGEYMHPKFKELLECNDACDTTNGKEMIRVGAIEALGTHFHTANNRSVGKRIYVNMKHARLNHYCMRTRENSLVTGEKWNKNQYKSDLIKYNDFFKVVYDPTVINSKRLLS